MKQVKGAQPEAAAGHSDPGGSKIDEAFEYYEKRFHQAMAELPVRRPWVAGEREEILALVRQCLGIQDQWVPTLTTSLANSEEHRDFSVNCLQMTSWKNCHGAAYLYRPNPIPPAPAPVVIVACGHGAGGKLGYRALAERLARQGIYALVPDNIGQGERVAMGHRDGAAVFKQGLSVQGLIVMETMGWLDWLRGQPQFDPSRIAVVGNSGGGTLAHFLGALRQDQLAAVSCSGYPSSYAYIHRKEKRFCHCNIFPGIVGQIEMWQVLGSIAPTPLFLFQGKEDFLFPPEFFWQTSRKVLGAYRNYGVEGKLRTEIFAGAHAWDHGRHVALAEWLCQVLGMPTKPDDQIDALQPPPPDCYSQWPTDAATLVDLGAQLTGQNSPAANLWEVFPPKIELGPEAVVDRGQVREIFAQFEAALKRSGN